MWVNLKTNMLSYFDLIDRRRKKLTSTHLAVVRAEQNLLGLNKSHKANEIGKYKKVYTIFP